MSGTRRWVDDPASFLSYAATNRDVKTIVVGNPTNTGIEALEQRVVDNLNDSYRFLHTNFTTAETAKMLKPYRVVFAFNVPRTTTSDKICANPNNLGQAQKVQKMLVMAVFCGEEPITEISAWVDYFGKSKTANLNDAIKQMAASLVPQERSPKNYSSE
jgi:hypothetical protein